MPHLAPFNGKTNLTLLPELTLTQAAARDTNHRAQNMSGRITMKIKHRLACTLCIAAALAPSTPAFA